MWVSGQRHAPASLPWERDPVPILQELGRAPGPVWKDEENLVSQRDSIADRPARSQSLYRLRYHGPHKITSEFKYLHVTITGMYICSGWLWGSVSLLFNGYWRSFRGVRRPRLKSNHSLPFSAGLKNEWSQPSAPPTYLHGIYSDNFSLFASFIYTQKLHQFEFVAGQLFPTPKQNPGDHKLKVNGEVQTAATQWLITQERDHYQRETGTLVPQCVKFLNCEGGGRGGATWKSCRKQYS